ncbi:MAG: serine--tRNA ligase [Candidatus Paceibacterota bacterium]
MLDIQFIRENKELIDLAAKKKHIPFEIEELIQVDSNRRELLSTVEEKRAKQNEATKRISDKTITPEERTFIITEMKELKESMARDEESLKEVMIEWQKLMVQVPNIPDMSVPDGKDDADNQEIRTSGEKPEFSFTPKSHIELMQELGLVDFERGTKVSGFRGYFLKDDAVRLTFVLWNYFLDFFAQRGLEPLLAPALVNRESFIGTGFLPQSEEDLYKTQDDQYLTGTAEVPVMGYFRDDVIEQSELPKRVIAFSPCYRREAGSHGKDTKGLVRVHEFYKLEQVTLCEASHEESVKHHEAMNNLTEEAMKELGLHFRTVVNCGGDLGLGQVKKYDIELWVPSENTYREISSASYFHDFQARRLNIRYRDKEGKMRFVHSLNSTAIPTPRILVALFEQYQQADGSVTVPAILQPLFGKEKIGN